MSSLAAFLFVGAESDMRCIHALIANQLSVENDRHSPPSDWPVAVNIIITPFVRRAIWLKLTLTSSRSLKLYLITCQIGRNGSLYFYGLSSIISKKVVFGPVGQKRAKINEA